jgi:hypothetical protein
VNGVPLGAAFNITNIRQDGSCSNASSFAPVSSTQLIVSQYPVSSGGIYKVVASNPSPGGGDSNEMDFLVTAGPATSIPIIGSLQPTSQKAGSPGFNLTVALNPGVASFDGNAWVNFGTVRLDRVSTTSTSSGFTVFVPAYLISSPGIVPVSVTNPSTGGTSPRVLFAVTP